MGGGGGGGHLLGVLWGLKYMTLCHFYYDVVAIKICNVLICFYSFDLSCPILQKYIFSESFYIVLSCLIKQHFSNLICLKYINNIQH